MLCLRCECSELEVTDPMRDGIEFFQCPACDRQYARRLHGSLTFRWLHPISLPLYCVLSDRNCLEMAPQVATQLSQGRSAEQIEVLVKEIELELEEPTQRVREILENPQTEEDCRDFLQNLCVEFRR